MNSIRPVNAMLFTMLVWGIAPVFIRTLSVELGAANALVIRYTLVSIGYAIGLLIAGLPRIPSGDWPRLLFVSLVGVAGYNLGSVYGFALLPAGIGGIIIGTQPLLIVLTASLLARTAPSLAGISGLLLAFAGTAVLFWKDLIFSVDSRALTLGAIYIFLSGIAWALYVVLAKPLILKHGAYRTTALTILLSTLPLPAFASLSTLDALAGMSSRRWAEMFYLVGIAGLIATVAWNFAAARLPSVLTGSFLYLVPVISVVSGALILGEKITVGMVAGGALILLGVAIAQLSDRLTTGLPLVNGKSSSD
jgi:drug/metabolite transporter (DMT)-like permease